MKRITIVAVFAIFSVFGMGCLGPSTSSEETAESELASGRTATDEEQRAAFIKGGPTQALELNVHPNGGEAQGPHPEPWLWQYGPHPEPWTGTIPQPDPQSEPDPNSPDGTKPKP